jgi:lipoprotein-anchoring transpeptidase ErfK/SrfK
MKFSPNNISRRNFLKTGLIGAGVLAALPLIPRRSVQLEFPASVKLGRVAVAQVEVKSRPTFDSDTVKILYEDTVVDWQREVIGEPNLNRGKNRRWVETTDGYIYASDLQPARNLPNQPLQELPDSPAGKGLWAEVTVPKIAVTLANPPARAEVLKDASLPFGLYYGQIYWIDDIRTQDGKVEYHVIEKHGSPGDEFWADATGLRPIKEDELNPINPDAADKKVVINVSYQTLSCLEGKREVYFCRVSTGAKFDAYGNAVDKWSTPLGLYHAISRKYLSIHMAAGSRASGYELFGVSWTSIFATGGVAIHATYWHNNYGEPMSHGCVNALPEDAKWVFLWSLPRVPYTDGKIEISGYAGTNVQVIEENA